VHGPLMGGARAYYSRRHNQRVSHRFGMHGGGGVVAARDTKRDDTNTRKRAVTRAAAVDA
jgi:hypothetical protein